MRPVARPIVRPIARAVAGVIGAGGGATVPGAPTIGTATAGNAQASVTFTAPGSNGGSPITGYRVTSNPGGITATGAGSPIVVTGLTNGQAYTFTVQAQNAIGFSAASAASNSVTPAAVDPGLASVVFLASFDTDLSEFRGKTLTPVNSAASSSTQSRFGGGSLFFPSSTAAVSAANSTDFDFPADFTIEWWMWKSANPGAAISLFERDFNSTGLQIYMNTSGTLAFFRGAADVLVSSASVGNSAFVHCAVVRSGSTLSWYIGGTLAGTTTFSAAISGTEEFLIGGNSAAPSGMYIDELRITKGVARYSGASFTVPTAAFPRV